MDPLIALAVFPIIFLGELPDKTMFASLVMATRGRPRQVWLGAAGAFVVHVIIAVTIGLAIFALLPHRAVEGIVAVMFLFGAIYAWREEVKDEEEVAEKEASRHGVVATAFIVIFIAEWGDLTQIVTVNLAREKVLPTGGTCSSRLCEATDCSGSADLSSGRFGLYPRPHGRDSCCIEKADCVYHALLYTQGFPLKARPPEMGQSGGWWASERVTCRAKRSGATHRRQATTSPATPCQPV